MKLFQSIAEWWHDIFRKRRLSMHNALDGEEEWHVLLSPMSLFSGFVALCCIIFLILLAVVAYTPVLDLLPGYRSDASKSRERLVENIMRLDSIERKLQYMMLYNENIALVMDGKTPAVRTVNNSDTLRHDRTSMVEASAVDSALRRQMEGAGIYSLSASANEARRNYEPIEMACPLSGIVTERFDLNNGNYGIRIAAAPDTQVTAAKGGTVVLSQWSPEEGYVLGIQHSGGFLSLYKNISQPIVERGQKVRDGEVVAYSLRQNEEQSAVALFEFELWLNGKPVDPEGYIVF